MPSINRRLRQQALRDFVGRTKEISSLLAVLDDDGPIVIFVHGIGGIGKSTLLDIFALEAQSCEAIVVRLDCRSIKPSEEGFLHELNVAIGGDVNTLTATCERLSQLGSRVILALDTYEIYRMQDTWLRQVFIPSLSDNVRVLFFGREAPVSAWFTAPGWQGLFQSLRLKPLNNTESKELLLRSGVSANDVAHVVQFTHGHPLALKIAAAAIAERPNLTLKEVESQHVVAELTRLYLADVQDPLTREGIEAASVVRRTTRSLLSVMLPHAAPNDLYDRLKTLPFVESGSDGLIIHEMVQRAIATELRAADPDTYYGYRRAAWKQIRTEFPISGRTAIWRYTADMIYLIEHPAIHSTFFPDDAHLYAVEPATSQDEQAIFAIALQQDGPEMLAAIQYWWRRMPESFYVARDRHTNVNGYYCMFNVRDLNGDDLSTNPITCYWWQHLCENPVPVDEDVLFLVRWIAAETGEQPSPVQGALWLDIKRTYMEFPQTRRIYNIVYDATYWIPIMEQLGFQKVIPFTTLTLDNKSYASVVNDFGSSLVPGWMAGLVDTQFGIQSEISLDVGTRELVLPNKRVRLSPLEFALIHYLDQHEGTVVSRTELLNEVWGYDYEGGSNVVDAMVYSLRKKLGVYAPTIETMSGIGYRFHSRQL